MSASPDISPKQARTISALVTCRTLGEAAKRAGCGESTLRRWLAKDTDFKEAWRQARARLLDDAMSQALRSAEAAALVLHEIMMASESDFARMTAAKALLDISLRTVERREIEGRMETILRSLEELRRAQH